MSVSIAFLDFIAIPHTLNNVYLNYRYTYANNGNINSHSVTGNYIYGDNGIVALQIHYSVINKDSMYYVHTVGTPRIRQQNKGFFLNDGLKIL